MKNKLASQTIDAERREKAKPFLHETKMQKHQQREQNERENRSTDSQVFSVSEERVRGFKDENEKSEVVE